MTTALVTDARYLWYEFGDDHSLMGGHPFLQPGSFAETAGSERRILNLLHASGIIDSLTVLHVLLARLRGHDDFLACESGSRLLLGGCTALRQVARTRHAHGGRDSRDHVQATASTIWHQ